MTEPPPPDAPLVLSETRAPGAVWLTLNRPDKHNALSLPTLDALRAAVQAVGDSPLTRYVVITGAGRRSFAAGGDLKELAAVRDDAAVQAMLERAQAALDAIRQCPVPVVALLNGDALGGGAELAAACDLRVFTAQARIGFIQARLAITPAWGGGVDLCQIVGGARALRMLARAELVDAPTALQWGLADAVARAGHEADDVEAFLRPLGERPPQVARGIKAAAAAWRRGAGHDERRRLEIQHLKTTWLHDDHWLAAERALSRSTS
ncbi:MAG: enoyl-CoA hydratase/isomerase family protein [Rubrivivax sp.]